MDAMNSNFAERLDKLERLNRRTTRIALTALLSTGAVVCVGLAQPRSAQRGIEGVQTEVRARKFVVVDDAGNERAELGVVPDGRARVIVWDKAKGFAGWLGTDEAGMPQLAFGSTTGDPLTELGVLGKRSPVFILRDADGNRRVGIAVTKEGLAGIGLYDKARRDRCMMSIAQDGHPQITLKDDQGKVRASLMIDDEGTCALDLFDRKGRERIVFQVDAQGHADAAVFGPDGEASWSAGKP